MRLLLLAMYSALETNAKTTLWFIPVSAGLLSLRAWTGRKEWRQRIWHPDSSTAVVAMMAGACLFLVPQWVVYAVVPSNGRYLVPGNVFIGFAIGLGLYWLSAHRKYAPAYTAIVVGMLATIALYRVLGTHTDAQAAALSTQQFQASLTQIVDLKTEYPEFPLLFYSTKVLDCEPIVSVASFLAVKVGSVLNSRS